MWDKVKAFVQEIEKDRVLEMTVNQWMGTNIWDTYRGYISTNVIRCLEDPDVNPDVLKFFNNALTMMCFDLAVAENDEHKEDIEHNLALLNEFKKICKDVGIVLED